MSDRVPCPICQKSYPLSKINTHVNFCLAKDTTFPATNNKCEDKHGKRSREGEHDFDQSINCNGNGTLSNSNRFDSEDDGIIINHPIDIQGPTKMETTSSSSQNVQVSKKGDVSKATTDLNMLDILGKRKLVKPMGSPAIGSIKRAKISPGPNLNTKDPSLSSSGQATVNDRNDSKGNNSKSEKFIQSSSPAAVPGLNTQKGIPLAEQLRPTIFEEYYGQTEVLGDGSHLRSILQSSNIPSIILWGPPGCGKTSLANVIATKCKHNQKKRFVKLSATTSGINDVKEAVKVAKNEFRMFKRETLVFIDEIHRFNKLQQDSLLPHIEDGSITLIGATTENPSFHVNNALLSRCKVLVLEKLSFENIIKILKRAVDRMGGSLESETPECQTGMKFCLKDGVLEMLANLCDGDARSALNGLEMAINATSLQQSEPCITIKDVKAVFQRKHLIYDKNGDEHYHLISALHKSIRGSDDNATLYWLARMLEGGEDPLYVARRLVRIASEDIGLADSTALQKAVAAFQACHFIGMPECDVILAHAAVYLARAPKSIEVYHAYKAAKQLIKDHKGPMPGVPLHLRNAPTKLMKNLGYGKDYKYNPEYNEPIEQMYLPKELFETTFFTKTS